MNLTPILSCILLVMLNMISCEKEEEDPERFIVPTIISGHLYQNCELDPYANLELFFYEKHYRGLNVPEISFLGSTTTDANGYYSFDPGFCQSDKDLEVRDNSGRVVFKRGCNGDQGYIQYDKSSERTTWHYVKILTDSSFTENDTLMIGIPANQSPSLTITGPFQNNQIQSTGKVNMVGTSSGYISITVGSENNPMIFWGIGSEEYNKVRFNPQFQTPPNMIQVRQLTCQLSDTILVDLRGY